MSNRVAEPRFDATHNQALCTSFFDGVDCSYICDIAVLPSHQGTGLGKQIVGYLVAQARGHKKIILYSVPGKESFYKQFGFLRMNTAMAIFENQQQALGRGYLK